MGKDIYDEANSYEGDIGPVWGLGEHISAPRKYRPFKCSSRDSKYIKRVNGTCVDKTTQPKKFVRKPVFSVKEMMEDPNFVIPKTPTQPKPQPKPQTTYKPNYGFSNNYKSNSSSNRTNYNNKTTSYGYGYDNGYSPKERFKAGFEEYKRNNYSKGSNGTSISPWWWVIGGIILLGLL